MSSKIIINKKISSFKKKIYVSGDKSISIRCILLASQAIGKSKIFNLLESEDVMNALYCIKKFGINYKKHKNYYEISGLGLRGYNTNKPIVINAGNSGTLARLIMGLLVDCKDKIVIVGDSSLSKRDFSRVANPLRLFGANIALKNNKMPVTIQGSNFLRPINY
ncbi:3-phosphoshikimate 1-carboxyvinyltransferase, partial [Pelagibacteraceae bacterium GOM-A2]